MTDYASRYSAVKTVLCSDWLTLWWNLVHDAPQHIMLIIQVQTYDAVHYYDNIRWFPPKSLCYTPLHETKGPGRQSKRYKVPTSPAGGPSSGRIPHAVIDVVFTALKIARCPQWAPMLGLEHDKSKCTLFYCCFGHYRILTNKISAYEVCIIWQKPAEAFKIHCQIAESGTGKPVMVTLKIQLDCFTVYGTTPLGEHICVQPFRLGNRPIPTRFCRSHKYFKDAKAMQITKILK